MKKSLRATLFAGALATAMIFGGHLLAQDQAPAPPPDAQPGQPAPQPGAQPGQPGMQPGQPGQPGGPGGPGGPRFDPARMQERMMGGIKERLGATDQEWTAIQPLVADVLKLQMAQQRARMGGMMGRRGGQGGPGGPGGMMGPQSPEAEALSTAVESENTTKEDLKAKLDAYRAYQKKQEAELKAAREKLRAVLTVRQEAKLVLMGLLD